jgi:hypothetical protein
MWILLHNLNPQNRAPGSGLKTTNRRQHKLLSMEIEHTSTHVVIVEMDRKYGITKSSVSFAGILRAMTVTTTNERTHNRSNFRPCVSFSKFFFMQGLNSVLGRRLVDAMISSLLLEHSDVIYVLYAQKC